MTNKKPSKKTNITTVSQLFDNGSMLELLYSSLSEKTIFAHWDGSKTNLISEYSNHENTLYTPFAATNSLIKHGVIKLPSYAEPFESLEGLIKEIQIFIHKYVDLEPDFEIVATYYVLLSWVYDKFRELPYLRLTGDYGTGKTRFLLIVGSICYKPIFASGASTISPIFHSLDTFRGTLILDEADFRFSDAKSEITKILNNGNSKGFPILRSEGSSNGQYNPQAFNVFGPKIVATRGHYSDPALESRFISERTKADSIRKEIPINLPDSFEKEATDLRNKLLMFRFQYHKSPQAHQNHLSPITHNRIAQVFHPLLALAKNTSHQSIIHRYATKAESFLKSFRSHSQEEQVLNCIANLQKQKQAFSIKNIMTIYQNKFGSQHPQPITPKWIGSIIRNSLHLNTIKRQGLYTIPETEGSKLNALFRRYDIDTASSE